MTANAIVSPRVILGWVAAVAATFALSIYLMALGDEDTPITAIGPSAFSRSAIGYAGLAELLGRLGIPVDKRQSRDSGTNRQDQLLVVTEPPLSAGEERGGLAFGAANRVLVVLPKWQGTPSARHSGWIADAVPLPTFVADAVIAKAGATGKVVRAPVPDRWTTNVLGAVPRLDAEVQVIQGGDLRPIVAASGSVLIGEKIDGDRRIWVLSDPDMLANHGLFEEPNAEFAVRLINTLRPAQGTVVFDETVRGFQNRSRSLLATMFRLPFLVVTIQTLAAASLLLWATMPRFGIAQPEAALLDSGKQGLIRNAALLLRYSGRNDIIVASYVRATIRGVGRQLRAPAGLDWQRLVAWLTRVGAARGVAPDVRQLVGRADDLAAAKPNSGAAAVALAQDTYRWKQDMLNGF